MKHLVVAGMALFVSGCTGVQGEKYIGLPGSPAWFATAAPETIADYFVRRCRTYGFQPGTVEMAQCVQNEAQATRNRNAIRGAALAQANAISAAASRPRTVNCNRIGTMVNCSSF